MVSKERIAEYRRKYNQTHKEQIATYVRAHRKEWHISGKKVRDKARFGGLKQLVLARDGWKCLVCDMANATHLKLWNGDLTVDHIDGSGRNSKTPNNTMGNLQTLCYICHGRKDRARTLEREALNPEPKIQEKP